MRAVSIRGATGTASGTAVHASCTASGSASGIGALKISTNYLFRSEFGCFVLNCSIIINIHI